MCPDCKKMFTSIIKHIQSPSCPISDFKINLTEFKSQYESFKEGFRLEMGRKRKQRSRLYEIEKKGLAQVRKESSKSTMKIETD